MKRIDTRVTRWRIMVGVTVDADGEMLHHGLDDVKQIAQALDSFSITEGHGFWNGTEEGSVVIEHLGFDTDADKVRAVAETIVSLLNQAEVWVTNEYVNLTRYVR